MSSHKASLTNSISQKILITRKCLSLYSVLSKEIRPRTLSLLKISRDESINELKKVIKAEKYKTFHDLEADELKIWNP